MNIVIIGTGYVGLVTGVGLASLGNFVNFIDLDENKIEDLSSKKITFYEPGLEEYFNDCLLYTSPSPRDSSESRMPSSA